MPKVSVIIPTHNRAELLRCAIVSVLNQSYQDFEIVVVDDASTDKTPEVITSFNDVRIKCIRHEVKKGDAGSRNTGIRNSSGGFLAFLDDDDEWLPEKLQMQVDILGNSPPTVGCVYTGFLKIDRGTGKILAVKITGKKGDLFQEMFLGNFIATACILLRRECFERVGLFDERMPCNSDYDMWIRVAEHFHFECIREPLVIIHYAQGPKLSTSLPLVLQGWEMLFEKYNKVFMSNKRRFSRFYYDVGILYFLNGDSGKSRRAMFKAIESCPLSVKYYLALIISLLGSGIFKLSIESKEKISAPLRNRRVTQELQRLATSSLIPTVRLICRSGFPQ
jgi:glycosyltransferase involved in cell wall biosynthesis